MPVSFSEKVHVRIIARFFSLFECATMRTHMEYMVYMVRCADGSLYTGITTDILRRVAEHNGERARGAKATRTKRPVTLVYTEKHPSRSEATKREYEIKCLSREKKLRLISSVTPV